MYRLAIVKEACYQDLWTCEQSKGLVNLLKSSLLRIGPLGLIDIFKGDFFILKTNNSKYARKLRFKQVINFSDQDYKDIENKKFKLFGEATCNLAKTANSIKWENYDIVISINFAVPINIRREYKDLVWICMTGEGKFPLGTNLWDYFISHNCPSSPYLNRGIIDMPYTFISPNFLISNFRKNKKKNGLYFEVNSFNKIKNYYLKQRPLPKQFKELGMQLRFHNDDLESHIKKLVSSKYFIKYGGRVVRGNSFIEAISAECVCFLGYSDCFGKINLPDFCYYSNLDELLEKIKILENNDKKRLNIIEEQKIILNQIIRNVNLQFEQAIANKKRKTSIKQKIKDKIFRSLSFFYYYLLARIKVLAIEKDIFLPPIYEK